MKKSFSYILFAALLAVTCNNIDDAEPATRDTFIFFYERAANFSAKALEPINEGYLLGGDLQKGGDVLDAVVIKVDQQGKVLAETTLPKMALASIKAIADGYLVLGYRIEVNDTSQNLNDRVIKSAELIKLNQNLETMGAPLIIKDTRPGSVTIDYEGNALALGDASEVILVGTFQAGAQPARTFLAGINTDNLTVTWRENYSMLDRNFKNSTSAFISPNGVVWASGSSRELQNTDFSYVTLPVVKPQSVFVNFGQYGENDNQNYTVGNICESALGFGVVGTYTDIQTRIQNLYFVRFDRSGNLIANSDVFFDAIRSQDNTPLSSPSVSVSNEEGLAIASTSDGGYILAGSMTTTVGEGEARGNGGTDILLIRMDPFGNILWNKNMGGTGNEAVNGIIANPDGSFVMSGTSDVEGLKSVFIMKTNSTGEVIK